MSEPDKTDERDKLLAEAIHLIQTGQPGKGNGEVWVHMRVDLVKRYEALKAAPALDDKAAFIAQVRGIPAHVVSNALNTFTPGINWRGSSKGRMAEAWAEARAKRHHHYRALERVTLELLSDAVARELHPSVPRG